MANRVLRDWTDSDKMDELSVHAERFFTRLIMKVDDFGCYPANIKLLKSALFPLKDSLKLSDVAEWLDECWRIGLVVFYEVKGKKYLQILEFKQRLRQARGKYPLPSDGQLTDTGRPETKRNETESEEETETQTEGATAHVCDLKDLDDGLVKKAYDLTEAICKYFSVKTIVLSPAYNKICDYVSTLSHRNELDIAALALQKYMAYKARSQEKIHRAEKWIGTRENFYQDGEWIVTDWDDKLKKSNNTKGISGDRLDEFNNI